MIVARAYDGIAPDYDSLHREASDEDAWLAAALASLAQRERVVDLGSGTGLFVRLTGIEPQRYIGVDLSEGMTRVARLRFPRHRFVVRDMTTAADIVKAGSVDAVVALFSLYLLPSLGPALTAATAMLRPGGIMAATLPTPAHATAPCACHAYDPPSVPRYYTADEAWAEFARYFDDVDVEPLPSYRHPGQYVVVLARARWRRRQSDP